MQLTIKSQAIKLGPQVKKPHDPVLQRIMEVTGLRTKVAVAEFVGKDQSSLSRGAMVDDDWIYRVVARMPKDKPRPRFAYMKSGELPKFEPRVLVSDLAGHIQALIEELSTMSEDDQLIALGCVRILKQGHEEFLRDPLVGLIRANLKAMDSSGHMQRNSPDYPSQ
jgi:hypothetical protein